MLYLVIAILLLIISNLVYLLIAQRTKKLEELLEAKKESLEITNKCNYYIKETIRLKKIVIAYEEEKYSEMDYFNIMGHKVKKNSIYEGKRALVGDYFAPSYKNTENVLRSLGFDVDIVATVDDVIDKIKYGEQYDVIFTNNVYEHGSGEECLKKLKTFENFNTPIIIHTISKNQKEYFVDQVGFDGYIEKPLTQENTKLVLKEVLKEGV